MSNFRKILTSFHWKGRLYHAGGQIPVARFSEIELEVLENAGHIEPEEVTKAEDEKPVKKPVKRKPRKTSKKVVEGKEDVPKTKG